MGRMMDIAREVANRSYRTSAEETRRSLFTEQTKKNLREQWRDSARKDSRVYLHLFNEAQGIEFYVTGWDGGDTISALTNDGFRNVSLNEVRGCKADSRWDDKTPLWAVMEDHEPIAESRGGMTRTRYSAFDTTFANFKRVIGENTDPRSNRKIVGESRKFAMGESFVAPKWIVAVNHHNEWKAATRHRDLPMNYLPVEVVRAFTEDEAIGKGRELHESGTPHVVHQSKNVVSPFIRGAGGMTLDMNALMEEARLDEGKETALKYGIKNPNSSGQGFHADHAKNPYHDMLEKAGLKYSHSTPVGEYRSDKFTLHHAYRLNRNFAVSVQKSAKSGNYLWSGGKSGSGRRRSGKYAADLAKYLKGAVKRHGALGESFATEEAARHLRLIANSRSLHPKLKNAMLGAADDLESNLARGRESLALVLKIAKGRGSAEQGIVKDIKKIASLVRMPVTEGVIGESMRVAKHFYVVDKRTGKVVSRGFPQVDDADEFFEKDKNFKHKTHQVISGWALSDRAFKN